ncbi:Zinc metalloproteinase nas-39 [Lucilia cuprina]|nr:Zinc metalloproteinase nas-39 [Lucilia cuprina]KAI8128612.1 Zinc metalloproteinase nas-39 [Lucilia cuprina]
MLPLSLTTIMSTKKSTKSLLSSTTKTSNLWPLNQQQIQFNTTKHQQHSNINNNKKHATNTKSITKIATIASSKCMKNKRNITTAAVTAELAYKHNKHHHHQQHHSKLTTTPYNNNIYSNNKNILINNESSCSNNNINTFSSKNSRICCKNAIKRKQQRGNSWWLLSTPSSSTSSVASSATSYSWIFCLWLWIAISSLAFVHCSPSPSSSIQQLQKRGGSSDITKDQCNKTVDIFEDVSSPEVTNQNVGRPLTCWYRFRTLKGAPRDFVLRLRFKKFKIGTLMNATHCEGGYLQIVDGNAKTDVSNRREPGMFCGEAEQPQTFISETSYVKVMFHTDNFTDQTYFTFDSRAEQQTEVYLRYGQHPELYPNRRGEVVQGSYCEREYRDCRLQTCYVQSPAYPGLYPRALNCRYKLHTRQPYIKLYLQNEQFAVDGQRCENVMTCPIRPIGSGNEHCPYDWLAVYDGRDEHSPLIGKFCGLGKFPFSIIGTSQYMYVEFVTSPAGPLLNTGFHFNVGNWPGHVETAGIKHGICDWLLSSDSLKDSSASEGIFLSIAHWYPPNTSCSYHIKGRTGEIVRLYFPSFRINRIESPILKYDGDCGESLTIYDSDHADPARIIKTFCDTFSRPMEKVDFVSTSPSLYVQFESKTGSYSGSSLYYWAHYDFFNNTRFGDPVPNTLCDEVMYAWKHPGGKIRSPMNSLIFKRTGGSDVRCQYKFVTDRRLYARAVIEVNSVMFKELPYNNNACTRCHEERVDKLVIWEEREKFQNNLACFCDNIPRPVRVISSADQMNLEMIVQGQHAITSYFKNPNPLFEASYEFAHGPLCGPITLGPSPDGELVYPFKKALALVTGPMGSQPEHHYRREKCIWELKVASQRDLWLNLEKARFGDRTCDSAKIEVYLAGRLEPRFIICPENVSLARDLPILSTADLGALGADQEPLPVLIQYTGDGQPGKNIFRLVWTELFHLPRNPDGSLAASLLQDNECNFKCPGNSHICLPRHLVCDGIQNCPNVSHTSSLEDLTQHIQWNLEQFDLWHEHKDKEHLMNAILDDESSLICIKEYTRKLSYGELSFFVAISMAIIVLIILILRLMCRSSKHKEASMNY